MCIGVCVNDSIIIIIMMTNDIIIIINEVMIDRYY